MGEYKPIGSEKLNSDEKLRRILELTYYNRDNKNTKPNNVEVVKESHIGGVYGIVKEKDGYYVKKGLNESSLDYIGGMFMKNKNRFSSYSEALKRLELLRGQEQLQEATKYVLKQTPKQEAQAPAPSMDVPPPPPPASDDVAPTSDMGADALPPAPEGDMPSDDMPSEPEGGVESSKKSDYMAEIQKYAGKLGQEIRDQVEKMESDDIKYVLNMVISAVDLDKLDLEDLEEIGKKFERDEDMDTENMPEEPESEEVPEPETAEPEAETPTPESDLGEYEDPMMKLERFVDEDIYEYEDFEKFAIQETEDVEEDDVVELDMEEIKLQVAKSVNETLSKYFK
jgi:hypothetical protein